MREQAERLEVAGWVRNEPDGSVTAHLEGAPAAVAELLDWCASGTPAAQVDDVRHEPAEVTGARTSRRLNPMSPIVGFMYKSEVST